jgi:hypothetical protein
VRSHQCRVRQQDDAQLAKEVCLKYLEQSQFALQLQPRRLVERRARVVRRVLVHVAQQARVLARARVVRRVLVLVLVLVLVRVRASQQVLQQH